MRSPHAAATILLVHAIPAGAAGIPTAETLLRTGDVTPDGRTIYSIVLPALNARGEVVFVAHEQPYGRSQAAYTWFGGLRRAIGAGDATSVPGETVYDIRAATINDSGVIAVRAGVLSEDYFTPTDNLYRVEGGVTTAVARVGEPPAAGTSPVVARLASPSINANGTISYPAGLDLRDAMADSGIYLHDGVTSRTAVREGQAVAGGGLVEGIAHHRSTHLTDQDSVVYMAVAGGDPATSTSAVLISDGETNRAIVRAGDPSPRGGTVGPISPPLGGGGGGSQLAVNDAGDVALTAPIRGYYRPYDPLALFRANHDGLAIVADVGDRLGDAVFRQIVDPHINDAGEILFAASVALDDGGFVRGLYLSGESTVEVVRSGRPAPDGDGELTWVYASVLNSSGQVAFTAAVGDSAGGARDGTALYWWDDRLGLIEVARSGDVVDGREITEVRRWEGNSYYEDPGRMILNDAGQLTYVYLTQGGYNLALWSPPELENLIAGDANLDGSVTIADFAVLRANFGGDGFFTTGDFDLDGAVTIADFALLRANFGGSVAQAAEMDAWAAAVPEPAGVGLLAAGATALVRRRRH